MNVITIITQAIVGLVQVLQSFGVDPEELQKQIKQALEDLDAQLEKDRDSEKAVFQK